MAPLTQKARERERKGESKRTMVVGGEEIKSLKIDFDETILKLTTNTRTRSQKVTHTQNIKMGTTQ